LKESVSRAAKSGFNETEIRNINEENKHDDTGIAETMENDEFAFDENMKSNENIERINFNTHEDDIEADIDITKNYQRSIEKDDPDPTSEIIINRNSTVIVPEDELESAHDYVQGMIRSIKQQNKAVKNYQNYEEEKVIEKGTEKGISKSTRNDILAQNSVENTAAFNSVTEANYNHKRDTINETESSIDEYNDIGEYKRASGKLIK
jgi:hypothetical protein